MENAVLCFGEILFDIFPSYERLGGAPFNFAYHMHSLGLPAVMISRVGTDENGHRILDFLDQGLGSAVVQKDSRHATGKVLVQVDDKGIPEFDIVEDVAYDYIEYSETVQNSLGLNPGLIYFGTLAQRGPISRSTLGEILARKQSAKGLYDMNLRQQYYSREIIERSLTASDIVKLNQEELQRCKSLFHDSQADEPFIRRLMQRHNLGWFCLTQGEKGSELFHGSERFVIRQVPQKQVADTVGAGDAYTAILALGILNHWRPQTILERATEFSGAVCTLKGAIPEHPSFYDPYLPWTEEDANGR